MTPFEESVKILETAKADVKKLLSFNQSFCVSVETQMNLLINKTKFMGGIKSVNSPDRPPVLTEATEFMGEPFNKPAEPSEPVKVMTPDEEKIAIFKKKIADLTEAFPKLENSVILESYKTELNVIRGVARDAGVEDYKTAEINFGFLDAIRKAMADKIALNEAKENAEKQIQ